MQAVDTGGQSPEPDARPHAVGAGAVPGLTARDSQAPVGVRCPSLTGGRDRSPAE